MSVIFRLAARHISRRFVQSLLFVIGVALGVAVVIAIDIANASASRAFDLSTESVTGRTTHRVVGGPGGLPTEVYTRLRTELGLRASAPVVEAYVRSDALGDQPLRLLGVDPFAEAPFRDYLANISVDSDNTGDGAFNALNRLVTEQGALLLSETLLDSHGLQVGESFTLRAGSRAITVTIAGVLQTEDGSSQQALDDLLLADIATAQEIAGQPGTITRVDLILPEGEAESRLAEISAILPEGARVGAVAEENNTLEQMTDAFELNLQALSLLALVVGVFLIYNTVTFSVVQRRPVIGVLRSLGTTRRQIFLLVLGEALILGTVGTILGLGMGIIFGRGAVELVAQTISDLYFVVNVTGVSVPTAALLKGAGIGLFASLGAAVVPAIDATRTVPAGVMRRSTEEQGMRRLLPWITAAAVLLVLVGYGLLQLPTQNIVISFVALFGIVVGGALLTPLAMLVFMRVVTPLTDALFGVIGRMAPRAVARSLSRTAIAVAALTVAISVIVGVSVMIASFRSTVADWLETTLGGDVFISPPLQTANSARADVDPDLYDLVLDVEGVENVSAARSVQVAAPDYPDLPPANLTASTFDIADERRFVWRTVDDYQAALRDGAVIVSEPFAFRRDIDQDNAEITLLTDEGPQTFPVVGVYYDYSTDQGTVYMNMATYRRYWDDAFITSLALFLEPGADQSAVINTLRTETLVGYDLDVQANRDLRQSVFEVFDNAFSITIALRLLATLVAFIGILSALLALQLENTRQYGVMRATGMTPGQLWRFTAVQTGLMGVVAGLLAQPIGLALAFVLIYVINVRSFGWTMQFYLVPQEFLTAFAVAVVAALLAGVYPAFRLTRLVTARALRSE